MSRWTETDIDWGRFRPAAVDQDMLMVVKAAAMVERNAADYTDYLSKVFRGDPALLAALEDWRDEEIRHGEVLGRYAELADPGFDFRTRFGRFVAIYSIPKDRDTSVRGSLSGEMLARCIVEVGTSSFYCALRDASSEPLLKQICHRIAGDEFRHYKMFYVALRRLLATERVGVARRLLVAAGRIRETDDDELASAWHAANDQPDAGYDRRRCNDAYASRAYALYRRIHAERAAGMVIKAVGLDPRGWVGRQAKKFAWAKISQRAGRPCRA